MNGLAHVHEIIYSLNRNHWHVREDSPEALRKIKHIFDIFSSPFLLPLIYECMV